MINFRTNIILHDNQRIIQASESRFKVIKAGKRFGKTKWAVYACLREAVSLKNSNIWYIAPTYRQAKSIAWRDLISLCPRELIKRKLESELMLELVQGGTVTLIGADNEDSLRGTPLDGLVIDEAAYIKEHIWPSILSGQLLGSKGKGFAYFISSPNRVGKNWFTSFHEEAMRKMKSGDKDWSAFYFTIYDNPTLRGSDVEIVKDQCTDDIWQTEYMAIESSVTGPLVPEFNYVKHVVSEIPSGLIYVRGIDWGISHPTTCIWLGIDLVGRKVYVTKEFYKTGYLINESANAINEMTGKMAIEWTVIDPSTSQRNGQTGRSNKDEFSRYGIYCIAGDNRDRGIHIMRMFFKKDMIYVHKGCTNLISELRNYQVGEKEGDDCLDPLRYILVRVHDYMFGEKLFVPDEEKDYGNKMSLFNRNMFPLKESNLTYGGL